MTETKAPRAASAAMDGIAADHHVVAGWQQIAAQAQAFLQRRNAHPTRSIVLLPHAQLLPAARAAWRQLQGSSGFMPRFETTSSWAARIGAGLPVGPDDLRFDHGCDLVVAERLLAGIGLDHEGASLASRLLECALQLAPLAAAQPPEARTAWGLGMRERLAGVEGDWTLLRYESALARTAFEWVLVSRYESDGLFAPHVASDLDSLIVIQGLQEDPLTRSLLAHFADKAVAFDLASLMGTPSEGEPRVAPNLHACGDAADEAERAAACVLAQLAAGRTPVGLLATDRALVRRIRALLADSGVTIRDDAGWRLSTTHAAVQVMSLLRAAMPDASSDSVLEWAKINRTLNRTELDALEAELRSRQAARWPGTSLNSSPIALQLEQWRATLRAPRLLHAWLSAVRQVLVDSGVWPALAQDEAGQTVLRVLYLEEDADTALPASRNQIGRAHV